ncbi:hypothetical protein B0H16DRAFT_1461736 [Mycena metata]|uniref:Uncharacterized protein n=1 Tax=Mycena metata TaxID=1033252 RepID=A0AAD7ISH1_9AGAR|nr:hypothetical protein B0H16DRAFT_1461733 [Mycena metata]KAJ7748048.1 hypothetical protein B0H16DRAFT_1461736 [Mycena metata]
MPERRYNNSDLVGKTRDQLVALVLRQPDRWPSTFDKFKRGKTNMDTMKKALLEAQFTTELPVEQQESPGPPAVIVPGLLVPTDTTPLSDNTPVPVPVASQVLSEQRSILLLIEDSRHPVIERYSQRIDVSIIPPNQASSTEILAKLQASISAIEGPARIGIQDDLNPGYIQFFAAISDPDHVNRQSEHQSMLLSLSADGKLKLTVAGIGGMKKRARPESPLDEPSELTKNSNSQTHSIAPTSKKSRTTSLTEDELAWLSEKVKNTPGFEKFQSSHNQRLTNLDRTVYWRFAARFLAKYYKVPWPAGILLSGGNTVRKAAIETVLGMKSTALTQAENSSRVLAIYYDGTHKSEEVVKRVEETTEGEADTGSGVLYKFLVQWEKDHPVND